MPRDRTSARWRKRQSGDGRPSIDQAFAARIRPQSITFSRLKDTDPPVLAMVCEFPHARIIVEIPAAGVEAIAAGMIEANVDPEPDGSQLEVVESPMSPEFRQAARDAESAQALKDGTPRCDATRPSGGKERMHCERPRGHDGQHYAEGADWA